MGSSQWLAAQSACAGGRTHMEGLQQLLTLIDDLAHLIQVEVPALEQLLSLLFPNVQRALQEPGHRRCQQMAMESLWKLRPFRSGRHSNEPFPIWLAQQIPCQKTLAWNARSLNRRQLPRWTSTQSADGRRLWSAMKQLAAACSADQTSCAQQTGSWRPIKILILCPP